MKWIWLSENKEWFATIIIGAVSFITGRKTQKISEKSSELQNLEATREIEKALFDDMKNNIDKYNLLLEQSDEIIKKLEKIIKEKTKKINELESEIKLLKNKKK